MTPKYAVVGNPIGHSRSPQIHAAFATQCGVQMSYEPLLAPLDNFTGTLKQFRAEGGQGLNVTVPFKTEAHALAHDLSPRAKLAGAVNTLASLPNGQWFGDNTDGAGLVRDIIHNLGWLVRGQSVLLLGAGGAVRGVLGPLLAEIPASLHIANRTASKAIELAREFGHLAHAGGLTGGGWDSAEREAGRYNLIINGTSASLAAELPGIASHVLKNACCYDMMYAAEPTAFLAWAAEHGSRECADGLGMLVEQAAESFELWHGKRPETIDVIVELRRQLGVG